MDPEIGHGGYRKIQELSNLQDTARRAPGLRPLQATELFSSGTALGQTKGAEPHRSSLDRMADLDPPVRDLRTPQLQTPEIPLIAEYSEDFSHEGDIAAGHLLQALDIQNIDIHLSLPRF
jgi:hypothetical protein